MRSARSTRRTPRFFSLALLGAFRRRQPRALGLACAGVKPMAPSFAAALPLLVVACVAAAGGGVSMGVVGLASAAAAPAPAPAAPSPAPILPPGEFVPPEEELCGVGSSVVNASAEAPYSPCAPAGASQVGDVSPRYRCRRRCAPRRRALRARRSPRGASADSSLAALALARARTRNGPRRTQIRAARAHAPQRCLRRGQQRAVHAHRGGGCVRKHCGARFLLSYNATRGARRALAYRSCHPPA